MNETLSNYVKRNYEEGKADLFSTFMLLAIDRLADKGKYGMINMHSWMFLSSFEKLRRSLLDNYYIDSLLHLGPRTFDELSGEVVQNAAFVISKICETESLQEANSKSVGSELGVRKERTNRGTYFRLVDCKNCVDKERMFLDAQANHTAKVYYPNVEQGDFEKIPGCPIGYWVSQNFINSFSNIRFDQIILADGQNKTGDNDRFLRQLWEVNKNEVGKGKNYIQYAKGGPFRKWYGNIDYCVKWDEKSRVFYKKDKIARIIKDIYWYKKGFTYSRMSNIVNCRILDEQGTFDATTVSYYLKDSYSFLYNKCLAFFNSIVFDSYIKFMNPTLVFQLVDVRNTPCLFLDKPINEKKIEQNINIVCKDWDSHETSWDFEANPLVALRNQKVAQGNLDSSFQLKSFVEDFKTQWEQNFNQLHENEEELNRQFIEIYGLQDELEPEVPKNEITILQQGEIDLIQAPGSDNDYTLQWNEDTLMKQLISYAVGVWMGRYKLGAKGLHIAHPNPSEKELQEYWYGGVQVYIDDDGLIPVLPQSSPFDDNLSSRISDFVRITFGEDKLTENLNYIEQKLGTSIEQYVQKDFWKDHKKMYQNRPIYWLFSSSKGAFKCLAYMHRMNAYTAERVRSNYLLPYIEFLQNQIGELENRRATLSTTENRKLQNFQKALDECREYHERLQVVAEQAIAFDLDDGVVVNYAKFGDVLAKIK